jgi:hypothetical protein
LVHGTWIPKIGKESAFVCLEFGVCLIVWMERWGREGRGGGRLRGQLSGVEALDAGTATREREKNMEDTVWPLISNSRKRWGPLTPAL